MSLRIRTISQLADLQDLEDTTLFGVSQQIAAEPGADAQYQSYRVSYGSLKSDISSAVS